MPLYIHTLHCTQHTCLSTASLCTAHNTYAGLHSHSALHTKHMPLYSLTLHCTQHTCRSTVSLCTANNTHAALQSHSALHTTHMLHDLAALNPVNVSPYCDWLEGWLAARAGMNAVMKWKMSFLY